jgi:hypothetical protein
LYITADIKFYCAVSVTFAEYLIKFGLAIFLFATSTKRITISDKDLFLTPKRSHPYFTLTLIPRGKAISSCWQVVDGTVSVSGSLNATPSKGRKGSAIDVGRVKKDSYEIISEAADQFSRTDNVIGSRLVDGEVFEIYMNQCSDEELDIEVLLSFGNNQKQTESRIGYNIRITTQRIHHECRLGYRIFTASPGLQRNVSFNKNNKIFGNIYHYTNDKVEIRTVFQHDARGNVTKS